MFCDFTHDPSAADAAHHHSLEIRFPDGYTSSGIPAVVAAETTTKVGCFLRLVLGAPTITPLPHVRFALRVLDLSASVPYHIAFGDQGRNYTDRVEPVTAYDEAKVGEKK